MQQQKRHLSHILALSVLYTVLFTAIIFAFPKKLGELAVETSFFSAPKSTINLPINITRGSTSTNKSVSLNNTTTNSNITTNNTSSAKPVPNVSIINTTTPTCASVGLCDKIHFGNGYTTKQKTDYYKAILDVFGGISIHLPD